MSDDDAVTFRISKQEDAGEGFVKIEVRMVPDTLIYSHSEALEGFIKAFLIGKGFQPQELVIDWELEPGPAAFQTWICTVIGENLPFLTDAE